MLTHMLDLSTGHMPCSNPDFGEARHQENEYGFVVWAVAEDVDEAAPVPDWLQPIMLRAQRFECVIINFDRDADRCPRFKYYEW